jgi:uncharacterized membrane protein YedE/YeeE
MKEIHSFIDIQKSDNVEFVQRSTDSICVNESQLKHPWWYNLKYLAVGMLLGIVFIKAELLSWFRIQEMFRLESFHIYGVIGTAVAVGMTCVWLLKKLNIKTIYGEEITIHPKEFNKGQVIGGLLFGLGWAMTGACPGPIFAQIGAGFWSSIVVLLSAITGTWVYGYLRDKLPH